MYKRQILYKTLSILYTYLILTHAMAGVENDPPSHNGVFIDRVVVKAIVGLSSAF